MANLLETFLWELRQEFPKVSIRRKQDSALMKAISVFLRAITFGGASTFMQSFTTTIGDTIYVGSNWDAKTDEEKYVILRHERIHLRQARKLGKFLFSFLYLFAFLPLGLSYFRAKFELEAYTESMRAWVEVRDPHVIANYVYRRDFIAHFTGPEYGYMWPFKRCVEKWYFDAMTKVIQESGKTL